MKSFKIKRLYISNFKIFKEPIIIDFQNRDFIVFDGPNGFGKTTIYDAIEILIAGRVKRIVNTEFNAGNKSVIYANDDSKPIIIKGEFINIHSEKLVLMRKIENPKEEGKINKIEDRFSLFRLTDFDANDGNEITQTEINQIFGLIPDREIYNLMYYIQQEDSLHFLKKSEKSRLEYINKLFNINNEQKEANKIKKIRTRINSRKSEIGGNDGESGKIGDLKSKLTKLNLISKKGDINYTKIINWKDVSWDIENVELNDENYNRYVNELNHIIKLLTVFDDFEKYNRNKIYQVYLADNKKEVLGGAITILYFIPKYNQIIEQYNKQLTYINIRNHIVHNIYHKILDIKNIKTIIGEICPDINFDLLKEKIDTIDKLKENSSDYSEVVRNIIDIRKSLIESVNDLNPKLEENMCPLCGYNYNKVNEKLSEKIAIKEKYFLSKLDNVSENIKKLKEELYNLFLNNILNHINKILKENELNKDFVNELRNYYKHEKEIIKFKEFCDKQKINLNNYINKEFNKPVEDLEESIMNLKKEIIDKLMPIKTEIFTEDEKIFNNVFKEVFDENKENIAKITLEDIESKKKHLKSQYYEVKNIEKGKLLKELDKVKNEYDMLENYSKKYDEIHNIYQEKIRTYSSKMITYLGIPFYIYSGKILQDYQEGLGVFVKSEKNDEQIRIKFVNNNDSKHDVINKFSSGQLSGLIISFLLSLNIVYSKRDLNILLIDDPLQSMDDINMASFVELLRHEFPTVQFFVSTHEDNISRYMRYKFKKFGIEPLRYNVKELTNKRN